ncbi:MAG: hypothetical protein KJZ84_14220 [Bryobacteraceae bacterium]|nr:hypothetical protein [Bryobacteraceae bacterium]
MATKPPFATGAQVEHPKYGPGSVVGCTDQHIQIKFDEHGERKFLLEIAAPSIKKIDRQPPAEKRASRVRKKAAKNAKTKGAAVESAAAAG